MGKWGWRSSAVVAGTILLGACSGGSDDASADTPTTTVAATTTVAVAVTSTTVAATTTTTVPPPYSFDGSVPPPPLNTTGDDFEAIFRSIDDYSNWLFGHNPDPTLIREIVDFGTQQYTAYQNDLTTLADRGLRLYDATSRLDTITVTDTADRVVLLVVTYTPGEHVITDGAGQAVDTAPYPGARSLVMLSADDHGRWRLTSTTPADDLPEVQL